MKKASLISQISANSTNLYGYLQSVLGPGQAFDDGDHQVLRIKVGVVVL